ncbi:hypothetical protein [Nitrosomonas sp. Nm34]|uniref:hypothetical protein n=1 Tax=Nitrosomonas sp. Nm34 TaxID=1881055 RepID=UPI0008E76122|nr:hypothetical protein [Nitrosomonas sp. Nm34]SFI88323.1 hypothetical protein SAMN05428978_105131 [Nitrosomonas sp. Nm34]
MEPIIEQELINKLTQSIANPVASNAIPLEKQRWNTDDCARYLKVEKKNFQTHYAPHPDFPKPIKLDRVDGKGNPLWRAIDIINHVMKKFKN